MAATGRSTRNQDNSWSTAISTNLRTGLVPESASTPGSAEVPDNAKDRAGATVTMLARRSMNEHDTRPPADPLESLMFHQGPHEQHSS